MALLEIKQVTKRFGGVSALNRFDMNVKEGEIVGVIGPNGAGKTSFFNCVTGLVRIDEGEILFKDGSVRLDRLACHVIAKHGISRTFQNLRIFKNMTLLDNVAVGFHLRAKAGLFDAFFQTRRRQVEEKRIFSQSSMLLDFVGLADKGNEISTNLCYGDQKRLEIARALASSPKLLLLDEPVAGMNATEKEEIVKLVERIRRQGISILLIEHDMKVVMPLSDRIIVMDEGEKIAEGKPHEIQKNERVIKAYLGEA